MESSESQRPGIIPSRAGKAVRGDQGVEAVKAQKHHELLRQLA